MFKIGNTTVARNSLKTGINTNKDFPKNVWPKPVKTIR